MPSYSNRIRQLRERSGKSCAEVAAAVGINLPWYYDVEAHDDETTCGLSLRQLYFLAQTLSVTLRQLLAPDENFADVRPQRLSFADLARQLRIRVEAEGIGPVEDAVGWRLERFLADPKAAWDEPVDFLRFVCEFLGFDWLEAVPSGSLPDRTGDSSALN